MVATAIHRWPSAVASAACLAFLAAGAALAAEPKLALGALVAAGVAVMTARAPVQSLVLLLVLTCVVPYGIQNRLGVGGGVRSPGLLLSDLLLLAGLIRAIWVLAVQPVDRRVARVGAAMVLFLGAVAAQFIHGVRSGHPISPAGQECRVLAGFGTYLIVASLPADAKTRAAFLKGLLVAGLLLGLWGMLQWFGHFSFGAAGDVGVRQGVRLTSGGVGQLQGGEYGFPVVIVASAAVLLYGGATSRRARWALWAAIGLNGAACLVTFERTFWIATLLGLAYVTLRAPGARRSKAVVAVPAVLIAAIVVAGAVAPATLTTARQRALSLGQASSDDSVRYRVVESSFVLAQVRAHPLTGSGLAAEIFWGQPWAQVRPKTYTFSHNGYLWLSWKLGLPAAVLLVAIIALSILLRAPPGDDALSSGLRRGAQGALLGLLLATMTFPSFNVLSITPAMGVLIALAVMPREPGAASRPAR